MIQWPLVIVGHGLRLFLIIFSLLSLSGQLKQNDWILHATQGHGRRFPKREARVLRSLKSVENNIN